MNYEGIVPRGLFKERTWGVRIVLLLKAESELLRQGRKLDGWGVFIPAVLIILVRLRPSIVQLPFTPL